MPCTTYHPKAVGPPSQPLQASHRVRRQQTRCRHPAAPTARGPLLGRHRKSWNQQAYESPPENMTWSMRSGPNAQHRCRPQRPSTSFSVATDCSPKCTPKHRQSVPPNSSPGIRAGTSLRLVGAPHMKRGRRNSNSVHEIRPTTRLCTPSFRKQRWSSFRSLP